MPRRFLNRLDPASAGLVASISGVTPDAAGNIAIADPVGMDTALVDTSNTTVTAVPTDIAVPAGLDPGTWWISGVILCTSAATTTGAQLAVTTPTGGVPAIRWFNPSSATAVAAQIDRSGGTFHATTAAPYAAGAPWPVTIDGALTVTTTTTTPMTVQVRSEIAGSAVTVKTGSFITWRRVTPTGVPGGTPGLIAGLPAGTVVAATGTTRPTGRTDLVVMFTGADPGSAALNGDIWVGA